jgi:hypothetical protein
MKPGSLIRLRAYGDREIERRVVAVNDKVVLVCRDEEYKEALREGREPLCVGFSKKDVLAQDVSTE